MLQAIFDPIEQIKMFDLLEDHKTVKLLHAVFAADLRFESHVKHEIPALISISTEHPHQVLLVDYMFNNVNFLHYIWVILQSLLFLYWYICAFVNWVHFYWIKSQRIKLCASCVTLFCVFRAQESWRWREGWSNPWSEESSKTAGHTLFSSSPLFFFVCHLYPLCSSDWSSSLYFGLSSLLMVLFCVIRSQDISADRVELMLPAGIEFRDNCEYECVSPFIVLMKQSIAGNYWTLLVHYTEHWAVSAELTALTGATCNNMS